MVSFIHILIFDLRLGHVEFRSSAEMRSLVHEHYVKLNVGGLNDHVNWLSMRKSGGRVPYPDDPSQNLLTLGMQIGYCTQTNKRTDGCYQVHYLPHFVVDKDFLFNLSRKENGLKN